MTVFLMMNGNGDSKLPSNCQIRFYENRRKKDNHENGIILEWASRTSPTNLFSIYYIYITYI